MQHTHAAAARANEVQRVLCGGWHYRYEKRYHFFIRRGGIA
jgi:hypothetical protein